MVAVSGERIFEALDRQCDPLPKSLLLDIFFDLIERDGVPDEEDDDGLIERMDHVSRWAEMRGVRIRI